MGLKEFRKTDDVLNWIKDRLVNTVYEEFEF